MWIFSNGVFFIEVNFIIIVLNSGDLIVILKVILENDCDDEIIEILDI